MNKVKTLQLMKNARKAHKSQMAKIKIAIDGYKVENPTAVEKTKCSFGQWLYKDDNNLEHMLGSLFYEKLENIHAQWHTEYFRIFNIFFKEEKKNLFSKLIGNSKMSEMQNDKAELYYSELEVTTKKLLEALAISEKRIIALPESKFD